jgi:HK97 family phage major capsid protein
MTPEEKIAAEKEAAEKTRAEIETIIKTSIDVKMVESAKRIKELEEKSELTKKELEEKTEALKELGAQIGRIRTSNNNIENELNKSITEKLDEIKSVYKKGTGMVEVYTQKIVGDITSASGTNTSPPTVTGTQQAPLSPINLRSENIVSLTTNVNTSLAAYPYSEAEPKDGDFEAVEEGGSKLQIDLKWNTRYATPCKCAAWLRLTEEVIQDVAGLESIARDLLFKKHAIKKAKLILSGDGEDGEPTGAIEYARVFAAGTMAASVKNPNFMDIINACITDIATTHNYTDEEPYMANLVIVNPVDFYIHFVAAKGANGAPLYPTASLFNTINIGGTMIIPDEFITAGYIFVSDMSKYNTTNYVPYSVKVGWVNDDFIKNQFVILAESRFHAFVKHLDEKAFIYDSIATIKAAIIDGTSGIDVNIVSPLNVAGTAVAMDPVEA